MLELFLGFWISRTVMAAVELGVFEVCDAERVGEGLTLEQAQAALGLTRRPARALLDTCVATGLLLKEDGRYRNSLLAARYLSRRSTHSLRNYVLDERWCWPAWGRLEDALRADHQLLPEDQEGYHAFPEDFFLDFLHGHSLVMGDRLAAVVDLSAGRPGSWTSAAGPAPSRSPCAGPSRTSKRSSSTSRRSPPRPPSNVEAAGSGSASPTWPANIFEDALPPGCDIAVLANVLHDFSPDRAREILGRVAAALPPGGRVVILEIVPDDERRSPPLAVAFSVAMIVNTAGGDAHTVPEYRSWLEEAGLRDVVVTPIQGRMVTTVIEATKA